MHSKIKEGKAINQILCQTFYCNLQARGRQELPAPGLCNVSLNTGKPKMKHMHVMTQHSSSRSFIYIHGIMKLWSVVKQGCRDRKASLGQRSCGPEFHTKILVAWAATSRSLCPRLLYSLSCNFGNFKNGFPPRFELKSSIACAKTSQ